MLGANAEDVLESRLVKKDNSYGVGATGQTGFSGSVVLAGRSLRACMYAFHSSGTGVSVVKAFIATQSHSVSRLLRSSRSSFHCCTLRSSRCFASKSSLDGFS